MLFFFRLVNVPVASLQKKMHSFQQVFTEKTSFPMLIVYFGEFFLEKMQSIYTTKSWDEIYQFFSCENVFHQKKKLGCNFRSH